MSDGTGKSGGVERVPHGMEHATEPPPAPTTEGVTVRSLTGVYHAEGTLRGEIAYVVGRALGRAHCALCDITHGTFTERADFRRCRDGLPVPFETVHLDERSDEVRAATEGSTPAVVAHTADGVVPLLGPDELEACDASPEALVVALGSAVERAGLRWT